MDSKSVPSFKVVDKRRTQAPNKEDPDLPIPSNCRAHAVLLGYLSADQAQRLLEHKGVPPALLSQAMEQRERAEVRIKSLPEMQHKMPASQPLRKAEALSEIQRVMSRPECAGAYPPGNWTAELVDIAAIIPVQSSLDLDYAQSLGSPDLTASNLLAAVKLCFAEKHPTEFEVSVDQSQKAISIHGINPSLEVVGLRYESQSDGGPVLASFMVSAAPNIVVFSRYAGHHFLSSGYHRVFRLMKAGYSHVPCVVREAKSLAQVSAYGPNAFGDNVLTAPRPPLFVDFADPVLAVSVGFPAMRRVVRPDEFFV